MEKLFCQGDPRALGIETNRGWDMTAFAAHIQNCEVCRCAMQKLTGLAMEYCKKCGHTWTPRKWPVYVCPACHRIMRDEPKKEKENNCCDSLIEK